jgi:hypothetical protein
MSYNGEIAIDLDSHIVERADRFYQDYIDPAYRPPYQALSDAVKKGQSCSLFGSRHSVIEPIETGRPLGVRDSSASRGAPAWRRLVVTTNTVLAARGSRSARERPARGTPGWPPQGRVPAHRESRHGTTIRGPCPHGGSVPSFRIER